MPTYTLLIIASLGGFAIIVSKVARRFVPEIVIFLLLGILIGPYGPLPLIDDTNIVALELLTQVALAAIIFLIGDRMRLDDLQGMRRLLIPLNLIQICGSALLVFAVTRWLGTDPRVAILLALIAAESGVLTVTATVKEERAAGRFTDVLLASLGLTNAAVAAIFGLAFPFVLAASGQADSGIELFQAFAQIVVASSLIGLLGGWILRAYGPVTETSGELLLLLLIVLIGITGAAIAVDGSVVVSALIAGLYIANRAPWLADRFFAAIRTLEAPIYLVFFVVAGADIDLAGLPAAGLIGIGYVVARTIGKVGGSALGGLLGGGRDEVATGARTGFALLPHAGMAIALAAFISEFAPELGARVSPVVLGAIVVFELLGPLFTRRALRGTGNAGQAGAVDEQMLPDLDVTHPIRRVMIPLSNLDVVVPRLPFLLDLLSNLGAEVVAVHVSSPGPGEDQDADPTVLRLFREVAEERGIPCTSVHRVAEAIARTLIRTAHEHDVDLVVMGEPARTSVLEPTRWGFVTQRVVRDLNIPVLVYPVDPANPDQIPSVYLRRIEDAATADDDNSGTTRSIASEDGSGRRDDRARD